MLFFSKPELFGSVIGGYLGSFQSLQTFFQIELTLL